MSSLKLNGVNKVYPSGALALYNVNMELADSEFIVVAGSEKCGKSTLLRIIAGLEEASSGEIIIGGKDVTALDVKERDVAVIFRNDTLNSTLNVYDNLAYGLKLRKAPKPMIDGRVKAVAEIMGLSDVLTRKPKQLTSEQRQKVALGRAIVREPKLYLFDDPLAGLDDGLKAQMRNVIVNLQARVQGTFIYATKNVNEALSMATRIVVMRDGIIQQIDTPANLYDYPANAYVAFFIGSPTVNFINGVTLQKDGENIAANFAGLSLTLPAEIVGRFEDIESYVGTGKKLILGIRPEDMAVVKKDGMITACVADSETIGKKTYASCDVCQGLSFTVESDGLKKGENVQLIADLNRMYIFDDVTRLSLLKRDGGYTVTEFKDADAVTLPYDEEKKIVKR